MTLVTILLFFVCELAYSRAGGGGGYSGGGGSSGGGGGGGGGSGGMLIYYWIRFAIASGSGAAHERNLNHNAATAVAFGLPREEALKAVTMRAAEIIGLGESHGSLEAGKAATLIVTTGDPFQITTDVRLAFIDGRRIDLGNRHKSLYHKYREKYRQLGIIER